MTPISLSIVFGFVPLIASLLATGGLVAGLLRRQESLVRLGLYLFVFAAMAALPVYFTGQETVTGIGLRTLSGIELMGLLALGSLLLSLQAPPSPKPESKQPKPEQRSLSFRTLALPLWAVGVLAGLSLLNNGLLVQTVLAGDQSRLAALPERYLEPKPTLEPSAGSPSTWTSNTGGSGRLGNTSPDSPPARVQEFARVQIPSIQERSLANPPASAQPPLGSADLPLRDQEDEKQNPTEQGSDRNQEPREQTRKHSELRTEDEHKQDRRRHRQPQEDEHDSHHDEDEHDNQSD